MIQKHQIFTEKIGGRKFIGLLLICVAFYIILLRFVFNPNIVQILDYLKFFTPFFVGAVIAYSGLNIFEKVKTKETK